MKIRKNGQRGFSHVSTMLETAAIVGWFAVVLAGEKRLDSAVTARRAVEIGAQDSASVSAARCQSFPVTPALGDVSASAKVNVASVDRLGLETAALPFVPSMAVSYPEAFHAQQTPLRHTASSALNARLQAEDGPDGTADDVLHRVSATRQLSCQDIPQATPTADEPIRRLRSAIWERNLRGYL